MTAEPLIRRGATIPVGGTSKNASDAPAEVRGP